MGTLQVLYVAADASDGSPVVEALEAEGYTVSTATDGAEALARLTAVDCVVTAASLPDDDGVSLCRRVRARHPDVPVVVYAAEGSASAASAAFDAGATDYVLRSEVPPARLPARLARATDRTDRRYRRLVETLGDMVYVLDAEARFQVVNDAAEALTGYPKEQLLGEHVSLVLDDDDIAQGDDAIRTLLAGDGPETTTYEMALHTREGSAVPVENHVALLPRSSGEFRGTVGVLRDISVRKRHDRQLRELHDATRELMAATTPEEIAWVTVDAASEILGYPINGVRLVDDGDLVPVAISERTREVLGDRPVYAVDGDNPHAESLRTGDLVVYEAYDQLAGDTRQTLAVGLYLPLGDRGTLSIAALDPDAFDETDRQLATVLAANAAAALDRTAQRREFETEHDRFAALFENIPDPTIYVEFEAYEPIVRDANPAFEQVFGLSADAIEGESVDDYILPNADARPDATRYNQLIQSGQSFHGEVQRVAADGLRDFLLHVVPYAVGERSTRGFAIYTDITDQKERERELRRQNARLEEFASVVSHDLRNPLNVAQGRLDLGRETGEAEQFDAVERALERMEQLIEGLLGLARQGQSVGETEPVDLDALVREAWAGVETPDARLVVDDPPRVRGDADRLRQLFENLFRNAIDHAGPDVTVTVGALDDGFYVEDDGPGIDPAAREELFDFGFSGDDGTGFGLAIVQQIVEAHGWRVAVADAAGEGARFEITGVESL
jgi:PAS domain S-box-containing protein